MNNLSIVINLIKWELIPKKIKMEHKFENFNYSKISYIFLCFDISITKD